MTQLANSLRAKLAKDEPVLGTWSIMPSPHTIEIFGRYGMDFVILDMEHGPYDLPSLEHAIRACEASSCTPLVRVPAVSPTAIQSALDLAAHGIIVPRINGLADAKEAFACMHYAPEGKRGFNPFTRAFGYDATNIRLSDHDPLSCLILEDKNALEELPQILTLPRLDILYIGVYDLSVALGYNGDVQHPEIAALTEKLAAQIRAAGTHVGLMVKTEEQLAHALNIGARMIVWGVDTFIVRTATDHIVNTFRAASNR